MKIDLGKGTSGQDSTLVTMQKLGPLQSIEAGSPA